MTAGTSEIEWTCREFIEFLLDYLDDDLSPRERARFEAHLRACPDCVNYLASYRRTLLLGRQSVADDLPAAPPLPEALIQAVLESRRADDRERPDA